ncbi:Csu type fimbrial protein [Sulfurisoma sediminicola]|uniref:Spore coat protein U-like protein n=1 Tax=Sulfurisoma sediminicola TaxID=1381557 RepID=A0A497XAX4_9PROT|nr:spore coat U domain-containing protein [Sulfurisoma sediminicola]RLJ63717.1 spore coat protein U-like protein [Sulfurisoma sediminicola]
MSVTSGIRAALAAALTLLPGLASAASSCTMAISPVAFGGYDVFSATARDSSGTILVTCARAGGPNPTVTIAIGPGMYGGSTSTRKMKQGSGSDLLSYNLFQDAARTVLWGQIVGTDAFRQGLSVPNNGSAQLSVTVYGRIPAGQNVNVGTYSDSVVVSVLP